MPSLACSPIRCTSPYARASVVIVPAPPQWKLFFAFLCCPLWSHSLDAILRNPPTARAAVKLLLLNSTTSAPLPMPSTHIGPWETLSKALLEMLRLVAKVFGEVQIG